jgi:hypothetical protein
MYEIHLINAVLKWKRRLEIEDERRKALRLEPYRELPTDFVPSKKERESIFGRISRFGKTRQPVNPCYTQEHYKETQPG